jgi:DNA polymerase-3 subunit epsilon
VLNNLTILDFETTGLNPEWDFVTEIGAIRVRDGIQVAQLQAVVNFGGVLPPEITKLTGITQEEINAGKDPVKAFRLLRAFIGNSTIVAHNAAFDVAFLNRSYNRYGSEGLTLTNDWLCTKRLAQQLFWNEYDFQELGGFGLAGLCKHFEIEQQGHHRALNDAKDCYSLFKELRIAFDAVPLVGEFDRRYINLFNQPAEGRPHTSYYRWIPAVAEGKEVSRG